MSPITQDALCRLDHDRFRVQRDDRSGRARAQAPGASPGGTQPTTHRALRPSEPSRDLAMPNARGGQAQRLADHLRPVAPARNHPATCVVSTAIRAALTERELEIFTQLASGNSNHQIAHDLSVSTNTVANHIASILAKLH